MQAELEKDPFDVPHSESELVGGLETEFTGAKLAFLHLTRDVQIVFGSALVVELFLGGPYGPVFFGASWFWYTLWFVLKLLVVVMISEYITVVVRTFPYRPSIIRQLANSIACSVTFFDAYGGIGKLGLSSIRCVTRWRKNHAYLQYSNG